MKKLTFLFLGGAKRVSFGRLLLKACGDAGVEGRIVGYELSARSPIASLGTVVEGLRWGDPAIFDHIDSTVDSHSVDAVVPFVDQAVGIAARYRTRTGGAVFAPVGKAEDAERMFDKIAAAEFFERAGIAIPRTYRPGDPCLRLIAKPRFGSASQGIECINSLQGVYKYQSLSDRFLIQERIDNRQEISVDCYASVRSGRILVASPRLREETSGGEAVRTTTTDCPEAVELASRTIELAGLSGAITVQLIRDLDNGRLMVMEVNPRFGGGCVASIHAGADVAAAMVNDILGRPGAPAIARPGVTTVRYPADVVFDSDSNVPRN